MRHPHRGKSQDSLCGRITGKEQVTYYAKKAEEDGMNQIAEIFRITALNEEQHAKIGSSY